MAYKIPALTGLLSLGTAAIQDPGNPDSKILYLIVGTSCLAFLLEGVGVMHSINPALTAGFAAVLGYLVGRRDLPQDD